jgi:hypothetical protein
MGEEITEAIAVEAEAPGAEDAVVEEEAAAAEVLEGLHIYPIVEAASACVACMNHCEFILGRWL